MTRGACHNCYFDGESTGDKGRDKFAKFACEPCKKRREQWGGATTQAKSPAGQEAEAKRKAACKYTAIFGKCNNGFCRKAKSDHYGPDHLCLDPAEAAAAVQKAAAKAKETAEANRKTEEEARKEEAARKNSHPKDWSREMVQRWLEDEEFMSKDDRIRLAKVDGKELITLQSKADVASKFPSLPPFVQNVLAQKVASAVAAYLTAQCSSSPAAADASWGLPELLTDEQILLAELKEAAAREMEQSVKVKLGGAKFEADKMVMGLPPDAAKGVAAFVNYPGGEDQLMKEASQGLFAINSAIDKHGTEEEQECRDYVLYEEAGCSKKKFQNDWMRDCDPETGEVVPERQVDDGHGGKRGMRFADFCALDIAKFCELSEAEVFIVRYYTTWGFTGINTPMRSQKRREKKEPHKLAVLVFILERAIKKLRAWAGNAQDKNVPKSLYRGLGNRQLFDKFMEDGGTEMAPMSTTADLSIALKYSQGGDVAILLWLRSANFMDRGVSIKEFSAFRHEIEFLYAPLTYMKPLRKEPIVCQIGNVTYQVVEVSAQM
jgi:hypothetical protein